MSPSEKDIPNGNILFQKTSYISLWNVFSVFLSHFYFPLVTRPLRSEKSRFRIFLRRTDAQQR